MKRNSRNIQDDEINIGEILRQLWKEKILILFISLTFMVTGYVYGAFQPQIYKTKIELRDLPKSLFVAYQPFLDKIPQTGSQEKKQEKESLFNYEFKLNLLSLTTLLEFVEQYDEINDFKSHLRNQNIDFRKYFKGKIESVLDNRKIIPNIYSFTFQKPLQGEQFLNDYIEFVEKKNDDGISTTSVSHNC